MTSLCGYRSSCACCVSWCDSQSSGCILWRKTPELMRILAYFFRKNDLLVYIGRETKTGAFWQKGKLCLNWERSFVNEPHLAGFHLFMSVWDCISHNKQISVLGSALTCRSQISLWDWSFVLTFCIWGQQFLLKAKLLHCFSPCIQWRKVKV